MKPSALLLVLSFSFSFAPGLSAQKRFAHRKSQTSSARTFSVGLAPFSLLLPSGKVNLRGEWAYSDNKSISLLVGIPRPTPAPNFVARYLDLNDAREAAVNRYTSFGAVLEHRFYVGQNAPRGFYLAPYGRYNNFAITRTTESAGSQYKTTIKGAVGGLGFGAAAGVQFRIGDFLTMDATLAGIDLKWLRGTLTYSTNDPENDLAAFRDKVQNVVGDIPFIGSKLSADLDGNTVKVRTPGLLVPGYRFNLTINYTF